MLKLLFLLLLFTVVIAKDLPGLDYLASGFDALKMISNNEDTTSSDRSKFRLFDLRDRSGQEYELDTNNRTQTLRTPNVIQVTNINMRNRVSVESVSYSYHEFFQSYFHSYSFEVSIPLGPAQVALGYHNTLNTAYQAINKKQTAIGMSTDWWGIFSVQLAPPYILTFDPIFNRSLSKLIANPTTDTQQMYYNQLISTFGTHYISSIIVGGAVQMFTQVTSEYQETHSKTSVEQQVSVGFGVQQAQMSASTNFGFTVGINTEDFKKNTQMEVKFSPAVITTPETEKKQWDIWLEKASSSPAVINRTLSPLTNLLIEYPIEIRRHLELTINYYLKNGNVPTIDQLSNAGQRKKRVANGHTMLPGLDVVGCGYDIFSLRSKSCLLDLTMNDNTTWSDAFDNYNTYKVPDGFFVTSTKDLLSMSDTAFYDSLKEFLTESYFSNRQDSSGFLGFGASTDKQEMRIRYQRFYEYKYRMAWTKRQVIWFTLAATTFPSPRLSEVAGLAIARLPTTFDPNSTNVKIFQQFFDAYGTHVVVRADMGGMLWAEDYFESCLITKKTEKWVRREIIKRYWFFGTKRDITETYNMNVEKEYQQNSLSLFKIIGGLTSIFPLDGDVWLPTVKDSPSPVTYRLQPIYTLLPQGVQRDALKEATFYFRSAMDNSSNLYIQRLKSETSPPPLPQIKCTERRRRKKREVKINPFLSGLKKARAKLCPIVGYYGMFCPGDGSQTPINENSTFINQSSPSLFNRSLQVRPLPNGIGMAIDISTGDILLPALKLTAGTLSWTDSESGQTFLLPNEVTLTDPQASDKNVSIQIFLTENDLVRVWLRGYEAGGWSGGEFARTKNISDVYDKFFKGGQATAISQDFKVMYTISMKSAENPSTLPLNEYAQAAIDALTVDYDDTLYNSFMDAWGTHITVSNKVGGMTEQQVIFKNCLINTTNFTDGITRSILERNLKQELLYRRPCIDHFYWLRRKKLLNHRIGGNVLLLNDTAEWKKTIVFDPALLSITKYIPWYDVVSNETIRTNLRRAITNRITATNIVRQTQAQQIQEQRARMQLTATPVYGYTMREKINPTPTTLSPNATNRDWIEVQKYSYSSNVILEGSQQCPTGIESGPQLAKWCSADKRKMGACSLTRVNSQGKDSIVTTLEVPIAYERNRTTGSFRIVARRQYGQMVYNDPDKQYKNEDVEGDWVHIGCSIINNACIEYSNAYNTIADMKTVYLCSGCNVQCADKSMIDCGCYCPIYEPDPEGDPFEPYCR